ncbi:MAG: hypothetical protein K6F05_06330 [Succinivibrio sp.]|nr:hypothetical protein [Succinivibrio sp.]
MAEKKKSTTAKATDKTKATAAAATTTEQQTRLVMQSAQNIAVVYANAFYTQNTADELFITACISQPAADGKGALINVQPQARLAMSVKSAAQLYEVLGKVLSQYKKA